ncbi:predicted protein [Plenodomus lingam JN3]|uniref:Predicted protein n=1 Tax=Leptosphaeria maculans (strain JN3 / isolate v23.1.3 / race Av1-4-5-6-7-8) TaxID=985895 RepID=E4ZYB7_LEPMJ|nr:predicted protein [Plenodomus lingam JN3]CBX96362.1 predicted protein [Plenodomus lingam JN3]
MVPNLPYPAPLPPYSKAAWRCIMLKKKVHRREEPSAESLQPEIGEPRSLPGRSKQPMCRQAGTFGCLQVPEQLTNP